MQLGCVSLIFCGEEFSKTNDVNKINEYARTEGCWVRSLGRELAIK